MFFDWLSCFQNYDFDLPVIADDGYCHFDFVEGVMGEIRQGWLQHEGSYSTSISVRVKGRTIEIKGNPSRFNRLDNVFGLSTLEQCISVYNGILKSLGLPEFTKCNFLGYTQKARSDGSVKLYPIVDGLVITELHCTTNVFVGENNVDAYLKAISMLPYRHSVPKLHTNGKTTDWLSKLGHSRDIYAKVYDKAYEIELNSLPLIKKRFGVESDEYRYVSSLIDYCKDMGLVRFEQKFRSNFLRKNGLQYWGLSDYSVLSQLHDEFLNIDKKLKVNAMDLNTLTETLLNEGICNNTKAANITALYAINWMNGQKFDGFKSQVKTHRARLRKIGIDILKPCNLATFSPVIVKEVREIQKAPAVPPRFYRYPNHLRRVA